jgi:hypothetical protein
MLKQCPRCGAEDYDTYKNHWADGYKFEPFCECRCGATWDLESEIEDKPQGGNQMKDTIEMAREAGADIYGHPDFATICVNGKDANAFVKAFEALVRADEREACARICEEREEQWRKAGFFKDVHEFREMAFAIRARGETK